MTQNSNLLKSGIDYPENWDQLIDWFHNDQLCRDYIYKIRWPNGFICPRCRIKETPYKLKNNTLKCAICRKETSITSGTIFNKTRTSLTDWFGAIWYITNQKNGVSALEIQAFFDDSMKRQLGTLKKGSQLTVVCRVDGLMMNVLAKECVIK